MRFAHDHPEQMAEIAALPLNQQNAAMRAAIGYDPDAIRDQYEENLTSEAPRRGPSETAGGKPSLPATPCPACGAGPNDKCADWCIREQRG